MMKKNTHTLLLAALMYFLVTAGLFCGAIFEVHKQGAVFETAKQKIAEQTAKEVSYNKLEGLLLSTKEKRALLNSFFITEKDTINFISELENAALAARVKMTTNNLSISPEVVQDGVLVTPRLLIVGIDFVGSEQDVKKFFSLLEHVPYHQTLSDPYLVNHEGTQWKGGATLRMTLGYDRN